jgi:hypothetical protein
VLVTFVDNVAALVIENCLMAGLSDFLTQQVAKIAKIKPNLLQVIASETKEAAADRDRYHMKKAGAEEALKKCEDKLGVQYFLVEAARLESRDTHIANMDLLAFEEERTSSPRLSLNRFGAGITPTRPSRPGRGQVSFPSGGSTVVEDNPISSRFRNFIKQSSVVTDSPDDSTEEDEEL